jgi:hypothetical protein
VAGQPGERFAVQVGSKVGAHRVAAFFAHVVRLAPAVELGHGGVQVAGFVRREQAGEEQVTVTVELFVLFLR